MPTLPAPGETAASSIGDTDRMLALLQCVLAAVDEAVLVTTADLDWPGPIIEYANPAITRMTGYAPNELLGQSPRLFQGAKTDRAVLDRVRIDLAAHAHFHGEATNYRKDGSEYVVEWLIMPLRDDQGQVLHWVSVQRDVTDRRQLEQQHADLLGELDHRVNNTLATVQSIASLTWQVAPSPEAFRESFEGRLRTLSQAHNLLTRSRWTGASLQELIAHELAPHCGPELARCAVAGQEVWLPLRAALPLTMAIHELTTNAAMHGALSSPGGRLQVSWTVSDTPAGGCSASIGVRAGARPSRHRTAQGFGCRFLERGLAHELRGTVQLRFDPDGASCSIDMLLPMAASAPATAVMPPG